MNTKSMIKGAVAGAIAMLAASAASATTYVFVGSWDVADGPVWTSNPAVLTGQQTAALLFGGSASSYAISTNGENPSMINFMAHEDGYGNTVYLTGSVAENYSLSSNGGGYDGYPSFSAYVFDHACGIYYCAPGGGETAFNYAFRAVPEPASWALLAMGIGGVGAAMRMRMRMKKAPATA